MIYKILNLNFLGLNNPKKFLLLVISELLKLNMSLFTDLIHKVLTLYLPIGRLFTIINYKHTI